MSISAPRRRHPRSLAFVAVTAGATVALTSLTALTALSGSAQAAKTASVTPTKGPVGTVIKVAGTCTDFESGYDAFGTIKLYYPDAFESVGGFSDFHNADVAVSDTGKFSGTIKLGPAHKYTQRGPGPAQPGKTVLRKPKAGDTVKVQVLCYQPDITGAYPSAYVAGDHSFAVTKAPLAVQKKPVAKGTAKVGRALTATTGTFSPRPTTFSYQWKRGSKAIAKATKRSYTLTAKDKGKKVSVVVTAKRKGYLPTKATSAPRLVS